MTKVEAHYELLKPADDSLMQAIARAHGHYGLVSVKLGGDLKSLTVQFDASRLMLDDVERALHAAGIPARRVED